MNDTKQTTGEGLLARFVSCRDIPAKGFLALFVLQALCILGLTSCTTSIGATKTTPALACRQVGDRSIPLETDTTVSIAYGLNQPLVWRIGMMQFLSFREQIPSDVYLVQPYHPGKIPVIFVHGPQTAVTAP